MTFVVPVIEVDDPRGEEVRALLERHLAFANEHSPPEDVHALDVEALTDLSITFVSARNATGELLGVGALKELDASHAELKSMHTAAEARGQGVARALLDHLLALARSRGYRLVSLETGSMDAFAPARALYARSGFDLGPPFADYDDSPHSAFMRLAVTTSTTQRAEVDQAS